MTKFGISELSTKPINYYNLDMIISVGYRVKSQNGIIFRKWASKILKDYMIKGYAVNQKWLKPLYLYGHYNIDFKIYKIMSL